VDQSSVGHGGAPAQSSLRQRASRVPEFKFALGLDWDPWRVGNVLVPSVVRVGSRLITPSSPFQFYTPLETWPTLDSASFITGRIGYLNLNRANPRTIGRKTYSLPLRVGKHPNGFDSIDTAHDLLVEYGVLPEVEAASTYQPPDPETVIKNRRRDRRNNLVVGCTFAVAALSFGAYKLVPVFEGKRKACLVLMRAYTLCT
jgi:hypothetical protein